VYTDASAGIYCDDRIRYEDASDGRIITASQCTQSSSVVSCAECRVLCGV